MAKKEQFDGYNLDLAHLASKIQSYLIEHHFEVAFSHDSEYFIQAAKRGIMRTTTGTRRSIDIVIRGSSERFEIRIGSGEWGNNILVSAPLFVIPVVGIAATAARVYSAKKLESNIWKYVKSQIELLQNTNTTKPKQAENEYESDYIEGYPGWNSTTHGKLFLEKHQQMERLVFEAQDGEQITIPSSKIQKASIVLGRKGLGQNDQLLEITGIDRDGNTIHPIFSISAGLISDFIVQMNR